MSGFVAIVAAGQENTAEHGKNSDRERTDCEQDKWGNDRTLLLQRLPQVFRALGNTRIEASDVAIRREEGRGYWTARIVVKGTGEFADLIQARVNSLETPFEFEWQRGATWPWD